MSAEGMLYRLGPDGAPVGDPVVVHGTSLTIGGEGRTSWEDDGGWSEMPAAVERLMGGGSVSFDLDLTDGQLWDLLACFFCQLDHPHDGRPCVPSWIRLGES